MIVKEKFTVLELDGLFLTGNVTGELAAQGLESHARLMLNVLDLMLSNISGHPEAAQEVVHN